MPSPDVTTASSAKAEWMRNRKDIT